MKSTDRFTPVTRRYAGGLRWRLGALAAAIAVPVALAGPAVALGPIARELPLVFTVPDTYVVGKTYTFTFRLYDDADPVLAPTHLWEEKKSLKVPATRRISTRLGSLVPFSNDGTALAPVDFSTQLWIEVRKGASVLGARTRLGPVVPYALHTQSAPADSVTSATILDATIADADIAPDADIADTKLGVIATPGKVAASALPESVVHTTGAQTIAGVKTFETGTGAPFAVAAGDNQMVANLYAARAENATHATTATTATTATLATTATTAENATHATTATSATTATTAAHATSASTASSADSLAGHTLTDLDARYGVVPPSPAGAFGGYTTTTADAAGSVGSHTSITVGADGLPVVSYFDGTNLDLKILHCGNAACSAGNTATTVDATGTVGEYTSITVGFDGLPVVSYFDYTNGNLKVLHCGNVACSAGNTATTVDSAGLAGEYSSITIGADGRPVVAYRDGTNGDLRVVRCGNAACSAGNTAVTVDSAGSVGYYTSTTVGADGLPVVSYLDDTNQDLKVLHCGTPDCSSNNTATTVDSAGVVGADSSITIGADGLPVVSYFDGVTWDLKVLHCGNAACSEGNSAATVDSTGTVGYNTSIAIGADGLPVVSYFDSSNKDLKVVHCGDAACSAGNSAATVDSAGLVGYYTSITIGADGLPVVSYQDLTNGDLKIARGFSRQLGRR